MRHLKITGAAFALALSSAPALAQSCDNFEGDRFDFTEDQVIALYECVRGDLIDGYTAGDNPVAAVYRDWQVAQTLPSVPGVHSNRFLNTFVNEIGYEAYVQYEEDDESFEMPVGSIIAKESFSTRDNAPRRGPLFIMERAATADYPDTDGWIYSAVQPNGNAMNISQAFCHDCHGALAFSDSLGYPSPEVRLGQ